MSYLDVFGSQTLPPSDYGYVKLTITADTTVVWPYNADSTSTAVAKITEVDCQAANALTLPDATQVSVGEDILIRNVGSNVLIVKNSGGTQVASVAVGAASYFYLTDNTSVSGIFSVVDFGVGTSSVDAASLVGYGIKAVGASLNQSHPVLPTATPITVGNTHRASLIVFTGGAATFDLTAAATLGDDFFVLIRNDGTGTLTLDPASSETIDGLMSIQLQPSESMFLLCTGTQWYSVGYGRSTLYQFTQLTLDVSAGGTITLTAAEAANKLLTFIGNPSGAVTVVVPAIVAVYYTYSAISTAHSITVKTASGSGATVDQGSRVIMLCDATNVLSAQSAVSNSSVSLTDGSVTVPALFFATQTNTGIYKYGTDGLGFAIDGVDVCHLTSSGMVTTGLTVSGAFVLSGDQVQIAEGGTGATTASGARTALNVPSRTGDDASGTGWAISITGSAASATTAGNVSGTVAIGNGGTGGTTQIAALQSLGVLGAQTVAKSSAYTVVVGDRGDVLLCTGTFTLALTAAATLADGFSFGVRNVSNGVITIDPNASELIDGVATLTLTEGQSCFLVCDGAGWYSIGLDGGSSSGNPAGTIIDFAGTTAPSGHLACPTVAGGAQVVSRTTYAALFAAIGTAWGAGDGSTTFGIPWFPSDYASVQANANVGTNHVGENLSHTHSATQRSSTAGAAAGYATIGSGAVGAGDISLANSGGTANKAAGVRVLKCVKY